jgi:HD-like signal output (HDOD) protein
MPADRTTTETKLCNLPTFSAAAIKLLQFADQSNVALRDLQPVVLSEPSLAAELLRIANSPLFAFSTEIRSVEHAIVLLGLNMVRAVCVGVAAKAYWGHCHVDGPVVAC